MTHQTIPNLFKTFSSIFDKFEPLSIITIFFLSFGGLYQVYALYSIGFSYIRFFSTTQLFSDSLALFITFFLYFVLPAVIGLIVVKSIYDYDVKTKTRLSKFMLWGFVIMLFMVRVLFALIVELESFKPFFLAFFIVCGVSLAYLKVRDGEMQLNIQSRQSFNYIFILVILFAITTTFSSIKSNYSLDLELENFEKIHKKYESQGYKDRILYFNDSYIFVEIKKDTVFPKVKKPETIRKIEILKFDKFFE